MGIQTVLLKIASLFFYHLKIYFYQFSMYASFLKVNATRLKTNAKDRKPLLSLFTPNSNISVSWFIKLRHYLLSPCYEIWSLNPKRPLYLLYIFFSFSRHSDIKFVQIKQFLMFTLWLRSNYFSLLSQVKHYISITFPVQYFVFSRLK